MSLVRENVRVGADALEDLQTWVPPAAIDIVKESVLTQVECLVWRRFDGLRPRLRLKVLFFTLDAAPVVEHFLIELFGARPVNCP